MPISSIKQEYQDNVAKWALVRDCVAGSASIKAAKETYLPMPNPTDLSDENKERYAQYLQRAMFLNVTGRTRNGLVGAVFRRDPTYELPATLAAFAEDIDGGGQSISQLSKWSVGELLEVGRIGLLADHTSTSSDVRTIAQLKASGARPLVLPYRSEAIINWRYGVINGKQMLVMVVLKEAVNTSTDEFDEKLEDQYRLLKLDEAGVYTMQVFDQRGAATTDVLFPKRGDGTPWKEIPFVMPGADNNQSQIDDSPLYALADVNVAHYRNSADYEEAVYMHGQGTLFIDVGQINLSDFNAQNPNGILVGARKGHILGMGGNAQLLQFQANSSAREAMQDKEQQMIAIGARLITSKAQNQTAEAARIDANAEASVLSTLTGNASEGMERALELAAQFINADPAQVVFTLNREFFDGQYDPQAAMAKMQELDHNLIAKKDYRDWLRRSGSIEPGRTDEEIDEEIDTQGPTMPNLDAVPPELKAV